MTWKIMMTVKTIIKVSVGIEDLFLKIIFSCHKQLNVTSFDHALVRFSRTFVPCSMLHVQATRDQRDSRSRYWSRPFSWSRSRSWSRKYTFSWSRSLSQSRIFMNKSLGLGLELWDSLFPSLGLGLVIETTFPKSQSWSRSRSLDSINYLQQKP